MVRRAIVLSMTAVLLFALGQPAMADSGSAGPRLQIQFVVKFRDPAIVVVALTASCPASAAGPGTATATLTQSPPSPAEGDGSAAVTCDGRKHDIAVSVIGAEFQLGDAFAVAQLCSTTCANDARRVTIRL